MESLDLANIVTVGGPVAAIAIMAIWINYKLTIMWMNKWENERNVWRQEAMQEQANQRREREEYYMKLLAVLTRVESLLLRVEALLETVERGITEVEGH